MTTRGKRRRRSQHVNGGLSAVVAQRGGATGFSLLDDEYDDEHDDTLREGLYGGRGSSEASLLQRTRLFPTTTSNSHTPTASQRSPAVSMRSRFSSATASSKTSTRQRQRRRPMPRRSTTTPTAAAAVHICCAVSENRARETCVASLDAGAPYSLTMTKQATNGGQYAETVACLLNLQPDEILLNEGRRHSPLVQKLLSALPQQEQRVVVVASDTGVEADTAGGGQSRRRRRRASANNNNTEEDDNNTAPPSHAVVIKFLSRHYFDQTRGADWLRTIATPESLDASVMEEYTLLSASHAVLSYTQHCLGAQFARSSVRLNYAGGSGRHCLQMDRATVLQLELLVSNSSSNNNNNNSRSQHSLCKTVNRTKTAVGSRLLRQNLMAPPTGVATIQTRLELVDDLLSDPDFFFEVMEHLEGGLGATDHVLSSLALVPRKQQQKQQHAVNERMASRGISALVCIKTILSAVPALAAVLSTHLRTLEERFGRSDDKNNDSTAPDTSPGTVRTGRSSLLVGLGTSSNQNGTPQQVERFHLLRAIVCALTQPALQEVLDAVCEIFTETTVYSRNAHAMRHQECFALKCPAEDLMTVLRKAFLSNVDDIYAKADEYAEEYGLQVQVRYATTRGYFLAVPAADHSMMPNIFLQPTKTRTAVTCTTEEISSLNSRAADNRHDLLLMTHDRIQKVLEVARSHYDAMAALCDAVALLDVCHCFADNITLSPKSWCRPVVRDCSDDGNDEQQRDGSMALMIRKGRFAIDVSETGLSGGPAEFIPNDTYSPLNKPFTVITGINGSGKSTYLKQVAMIVILAQCGSYVPAEQACIPIRDQLFCRIGNADDQEHNLSTFLLEMKETAFICNHAAKGSLVLVDELGRATSNEDGVAIAWATSEYLLKKQAMTLFVTHYPQLTRLADTYPHAVQNVHLSATVVPGSAGDIRYTHQLQSGACPVSAEYGVELAAACGWPSEVFEQAHAIQQQVEESLPDNVVCDTRPNEQDAHMAGLALGLVEEIRGSLGQLESEAAVLSPMDKRQRLYDLQQRVVTRLQSSDGDRLQHALDGLLLGDRGPRRLSPRQQQPQEDTAINNFDDANREQVEEADDGNSSLSSSSDSSCSSSESSSDGCSSSEDSESSDEDDESVAGQLP